MNFTIRPVEDKDRPWVLEIIRGWGADFIVSRSRKIFAADLPAFIAEGLDGAKLGLITYEIIGDQCEVVTLDAFTQFAGVGTALMNRVIDTARAQGCRRVWLITTNDNLDAIRFYQKRGFTIASVHVGAIAHSRTMKPSIPLIGHYGIPIRDEVEFEMWV
jgi:N-acetylglutamate synthase-like GNAT family acetyltransferase